MIGDFNIRDNDWDPLYTYYSTHADTLRKVTDTFNLELFMPINQVPTRYTDNLSESNSVIDLMLIEPIQKKSTLI